MKRYIVVEEDGVIIKVWDGDEKQMYVNRGLHYEKLPLDIHSHSKLHPYATYKDTDTFPPPALLRNE